MSSLEKKLERKNCLIGLASRTA